MDVRPPAPKGAKAGPGSKLPQNGGMPLSIKLIAFGVTMMVFSSVALYRREFLGQEKRKQLGEFTPDGGLRMFDEKEIAERERQSFFTRIFGSERR